MNDLEKKLQQHTSHMRLTQHEKDAMRLVLQTHMHTYPLPTPSPWFGFALQTRLIVPAFAVLLLCVSTTYAAQDALPGDLLYPIKIHINEQVEVALADTPEKKIAVEVQLAERRVGEVQTLAARGTLDVSTTRELEDNFNAHAKEALILATTIEEKEKISDEQPETSSAVRTMTMTFEETDATSTDDIKTYDETSATTTRIFKLKDSLKAQSDIFNTLKKEDEYETPVQQDHE